jgi:hypothetical protein
MKTATPAGMETAEARRRRSPGSALRRYGILLTLAMCGCAGMREWRDLAPAPGAQAERCGETVSLPADLLEPGGVVLFGEIHGVQELPAAFGGAVCAAASSGHRIEVGLEAPRGDQPNVDRFLGSPGSPADIEALLGTPFWSSEYQDGRRSRARVDLLDRLRRMRASGLPVSVFLFDIDRGEDESRRERKMADNLEAVVRSHPAEVTLVLIGEVHAWKTPGSPWDPGFKPMGWYLAEAGLRVRSLGRATPAGTAWICTSGSPGDCGSKSTKATRSLPSGRTTGVELFSSPGPHGYDGLYGTATLTASPPAARGNPPHPPDSGTR